MRNIAGKAHKTAYLFLLSAFFSTFWFLYGWRILVQLTRHFFSRISDNTYSVDLLTLSVFPERKLASFSDFLQWAILDENRSGLYKLSSVDPSLFSKKQARWDIYMNIKLKVIKHPSALK